MHVINFVSHMVASGGYKYTFAIDTEGSLPLVQSSMLELMYCVVSEIDHTSWWDPTSVVLAISVATAALCSYY
jgi:hypothetical protein